MTTVLLIRHGNHMLGAGVIAGRRPGVALSPAGSSEADELVERLHGVRIDAIYSSPIDRALATAAPLARSRTLPIRQRDEFAEIDYGEWTGASIEDLRGDPRWRAWNEFRSGHRVPGGESMVEVQTRAVGGVLGLVEQHGDDACIAVFSHGDVIKAALAHFTGVPLDLFRRLEVSTASVTAMVIAELGAHVLFVNDVARPSSLLPAR